LKVRLPVLALVTCAACAGAAPEIMVAGGSSRVGTTPQPHVWIAFSGRPGTPVQCFHIAPLDTALYAEDSGSPQARLVGQFATLPDALAAQGDAFLAAFIDRPKTMTPPDATRVARARTLRAEHGWINGPVGQLPALPPGRALLGLTQTTRGDVFAVLGPSRGSATISPTLMLLHQGVWSPVPWPDGAVAASISIHDGGAGPALWTRPRDQDALWIGTPPEPAPPSTTLDTAGEEAPIFVEAPEQRPRATPEWERVEVPAWVAQAVAGRMKPAIIPGEQGPAPNLILIGADERERVSVLACSRGEQGTWAWRRVAQLSVDCPRIEDLRAVGADGVAALVWTEESLQRERTAPVRYMVVSTRTGALLQRGDLRIAGPASGAEYRVVGVLLAYVLGLVGVMLARPGADPQVWSLPDGYAIAPAGRRFLAGTTDALLATVVGWWAVKLPAGADGAEAGILWRLLFTREGQALVLLTLAAGFLVGTVMEATTGRTLGKLLFGCSVTRVEAANRPAPPPLHRAAVRNLVKWFLPPIGALELLGLSPRGRGDVLARTAVVTPAVEDGEDRV
jgi:hypothetical protein